MAASTTKGKTASAKRKAPSKKRKAPARSNSNGTRDTFSNIASKAKVPAAAVGGMVAGAAGGVALARRRSNGKVAKAFGSATKEIGKAGYRVGQLTNEVRRVRESVAKD
jgi:hypothetical protein